MLDERWTVLEEKRTMNAIRDDALRISDVGRRRIDWLCVNQSRNPIELMNSKSVAFYISNIVLEDAGKFRYICYC